MHTIARTLYVGLLAGTAFTLLGAGPPGSFPTPAATADTGQEGGVVYLGGGLSDEQVIALGAAVASQPDATMLLDSKPLTPYLKHFLAARKPARVVPIGDFPNGKSELEKRLGLAVEEPSNWRAGPPFRLWPTLFPAAKSLVVCPSRPRSLLLRAACLAGAKGAPLWISANNPAESPLLKKWLKRLGTREMLVAGAIDQVRLGSPGVRVVRLATEEAVDAAYLRQIASGGRIETAVAANPADFGKDLGGMSVLAPWLAVSKRAALLLTRDSGADVEEIVTRAAQRKQLRHLDTLILAAGLKSIPMQERPNPIPTDKDPAIQLEPLTPQARPASSANNLEDRLVSWSIGRLFHDDRAVIPLMLARQKLMAATLRAPAGPRRALVVSNPGGSLPLLEVFSRNTAQELRNAGYEVTALYGKDVTGPDLRKRMVGQDVFLWEGHHNTLIKDWGFPGWNEPLPPTFVFLQSCLALKDYKVHPLLGRGAIGVVGTSTRTYSGSGGAFSLAFFNALVYEGQSLGGSLRQAKNFMIAYALLKEKRLGAGAARTGANHRAAWSFTLWGDPTFRLPRPDVPATRLSAVRHEVTGNRIVVELPTELHGKVLTAKYNVRMPANSRLAGLVRKKKEEDTRPLVPFVFAEVHLPRAKPGLVPRLRTRLPASNWVFVWDQRRKTGYLLATPRSSRTAEMRFQVEWPGPTVADGEKILDFGF
jgi:hypothetical protein